MHITLTPLFVNVDALGAVLGTPPDDLSRQLSNFRGVVQTHNQMSRDLARAAGDLGISELPAALLTEGQLFSGRLISIQQAFYFRRESTDLGPRVKFHAKMTTDPGVTVTGYLDPQRFTGESSHGHLSGRTNVEIIGHVLDATVDTIRVRALFVGWRAFTLEPFDRRASLMQHTDRQVFPSQIDNFMDVDWKTPLTSAQKNATNDMPEASVKEAIATLLHEFNVPKDWGGETSDLYSLNVRIGGEPVSSSWLLKGRSVRRIMTVADLGKNGDQIVRLASEDCGLLVVQSNRGQVAAVKNTLAAFAYDMRQPRRYMLISGDDTGKLLRHTGFIK